MSERMTIAQCLDNIGHGVIYHPAGTPHSTANLGVITSVNESYAFVRYHGDEVSKSTRPCDLILLPSEEEDA